MSSLNKISICVLLLALALSGCVISGGTMTVQPACQGGTVSPGFEGVWLNWQTLSILAASTVFLVAAFVYAVGHALTHKKVTMWAKTQMEEAALAMAITIFVIGLVSFLCTFDLKTLGISTACTGAECNIIETAFNHLFSLYNTIMSGFLVVAGMNAVMASWATMSIGKAPGGVGIIITPLAVLGDIASSLTMAMVILMTSAIVTITQMVLLKMTESLFVILFPIGVLLRSFGITRGFGGGLIALAIGFFIFYPLLVVLFYGSVVGSVQTTYGSMTDSFKEGGLSPTTASWSLNPIDSVVRFVGPVIMGAVFMPLIMFMILVSFVKGLSHTLGEEVDVSNLTRLI